MIDITQVLMELLGLNDRPLFVAQENGAWCGSLADESSPGTSIVDVDGVEVSCHTDGETLTVCLSEEVDDKRISCAGRSFEPIWVRWSTPVRTTRPPAPATYRVTVSRHVLSPAPDWTGQRCWTADGGRWRGVRSQAETSEVDVPGSGPVELKNLAVGAYPDAEPGIGWCGVPEAAYPVVVE